MRGKRASFLIIASILLLGIVYSRPFPAEAQTDSNWLLNAAPSLSKVTDLPANVSPDSHNTDCTPVAYTPPGQPNQVLCGFASPFGLIADGRLVIGPNQLRNVYGTSFSSNFMPTVDSSLALVSVTSSQIGNFLGIYRHLTKVALRTHTGENGGTYYDVAAAPDEMLRNPATGRMLAINVNSIAFSANGEWMVTDLPQAGLLRVHMTDLSTQLFSRPLEPSWYLGVAAISLAISDDGSYAAANTDLFGTGNVSVYDLSTCSDQLNVATSQRRYCAGKDIWHGTRTDVYLPGEGVLATQPDMQQPVHIRFVNDDTVSFSARYAVTSPTHYKAAMFVATAPAAKQHKIGLLGLGDSYISGQGAFVYRVGTDTQNNTCHLSELSYPFILGAEYFDSYNSVACSGAMTRNLVQKLDTKATMETYEGQVTDKVEEKDRVKNPILANFLPGYLYQQEFASKYLPEAMILSVGGDDVGFGNIVKACVANAGGGTCYDTYEDRAELVNEINSTYSKLVTTYTTLREQSGSARLYVVGYPQIAKVGGDCGLNVHLNSKEVAFAAQLIDYLDGVVQQAAEAAGVFYVDTQHAFDGHRLCEAGDKAMNGVTMGNDAGVTILGHTINFIGTETYHPTQLGYRLLAQAIAHRTSGLSAPMPIAAPYTVPAFDPTAPILQNLTHTGRPTNLVTTDNTIAADFMLHGDSQLVTVSGSDVQLQPGSRYQVVLHSDPILLDEGGVDAAGNIATTIHIPADVAPGFHTLHVYGKDMAGNNVDVQKMVYVAASVDDYDGDGVPNSANACEIFPASSQDVDEDGVDDACDAEITIPPTKTSDKPMTDPALAPISVSSSIFPANPLPPAQPVSQPVAQAAVLDDMQLGNEVLGDAVSLTSDNVSHPVVAVIPAVHTKSGSHAIWYAAFGVIALLGTVFHLGVRRFR